MVFIRNWYDLLGRMKFSTSYGQNALKHSIEVAQLSGTSCSRNRCGCHVWRNVPDLLHDIGKSVDHEMEGSHIQLGVELVQKVSKNLQP